MKKVKVLFGMLASLAMIVGMVSCSQEDDGIDNNASILGTWGCVHSTKYFISHYYDHPWDTTYSENDHVGKTVVFKDDGTFTVSANIGYGFEKDEKSWMKDGSLLYIGSGHYKWNIRQLTNDKLVIFIKYWENYQHEIVYREPEEFRKYIEVLLEFRRQN